MKILNKSSSPIAKTGQKLGVTLNMKNNHRQLLGLLHFYVNEAIPMAKNRTNSGVLHFINTSSHSVRANEVNRIEQEVSAS